MEAAPEWLLHKCTCPMQAMTTIPSTSGENRGERLLQLSDITKPTKTLAATSSHLWYAYQVGPIQKHVLSC